ncbi:TonB-dependent receptor [Gallaecimonas mangrovi]|uniref:TonB-dependent receptor n=1 Tax=Gallaecimonas mangrovi TaxID=2291597 RepID=UPI000E208278|nr:TonB-dependent receptor [Gallaecimonas mangrovi]
MIKGLVKSRLALALSLALGASSVAYADNTSSSVRGTVTGPEGQPLANTKIVLMHQPTGTVTELKTNADGTFSANGLRVGGPYLLVIDSDKFQDLQQDGIFLQLGQTLRLNEQLKAAADDTEKLTVYGEKITSNRGASSVFGADDIAKAPTFNRDLKEVARANPYANMLPGSNAPMSFAGVNPKYNSISIDGVGVNDDFGLNGNGYPTQASPISLDAVDQIAVEVAPFDASEGGYAGGHINAVTKSGTNEFHGSLAYEYMSDSLAGTPENEGEDVPLDFKRDTYSLTLGGPIIKDKLFFFTSYQKSKEPTQVEWGPDGAGAANASNVTEAEYEQIKQIASDVYGVDAGGWDSAPETENENFLAKIDWNINSDNRLAFTYNRVRGNETYNQSSSASTLRLDTNWYNYEQNMDTYRVSLFSDWTPDISTEFYASYKKVESISGNKVPWGQVTVRTDDGSVIFGTDDARQANELNNKTLKIGAKVNYSLGDHQIKFGAEYEKLDIFNLYVRNSLGSWTFDSIDDFANQEASSLDYSSAYTNQVDDAAADFSLGQANAYVQDNWYLNDQFELALGMRYERYIVSDKPTYNQNFYDRYGFSNQENMDGLDIWLPRAELTWYATDALTVRGGIGRFSGGRPNVFISNAFTNDGVTLVSYDQDAAAASGDYLSDVDFVSGVPSSVTGAMSEGDGNTNVIDPNYKIPSDWVARLNTEYHFDIPNVGDNFTATAEIMRKWMTDNNQWKDISRCVSGQAATGVNIYEPCDSSAQSDHYDLMLTNEKDDGKAWIFTTSLAKQWDNGFNAYASYTYEDIDEGNPGTSSTADSNYQYNIVKDRNEEELGTADYEVKHSFKLVLGYTHQFVNGYNTNFNLYFQRRSGTHYSYTMGMYQDSDFGDNSSFYSSSSYLVYVPSGPDDPKISPEGMSYDDIMKYVNQAGLGKYAGGYAPKGTGTTPWVNTMDLSIQQEVPGFAKGQKGLIYLTVSNFLNLLNKDWGQVKTMEYTDVSLMDFGGLDSEGRIIYEEPYSKWDGKNWDTFQAEESTWRLKIGVKYSF